MSEGQKHALPQRNSDDRFATMMVRAARPATDGVARHRKTCGRVGEDWSPSLMTDIELLTAIVRGDRDIAASLSSVDAEAFCRRAAEHGVLPLVADRLAHGEHVPAALRTLLRTRQTYALVVDLARVAELKQLLRALARGGVLPLLLKGAHLAYSHYARPYLRPKPDTDLLVPPHARDAVRHIVSISATNPAPRSQASPSSRRRHSRSGAAAGWYIWSTCTGRSSTPCRSRRC